jgi:hypothetical protein
MPISWPYSYSRPFDSAWRDTLRAAFATLDAAGAGALANLNATTDPTATDDSAAGYEAGSLWINTSAAGTGDGFAWVCLLPTAGAAVWTRLDNQKMNLQATAAPTVNTGNLDTDGYIPGSFWVDQTNDAAYICLDPGTNTAGVPDGNAVWYRIDNAGEYHIEIVSITATTPGSVSDVAFKVVDQYGTDVAEVTHFTWWLASSATTHAIHGTAPAGGATLTTGTDGAAHVANLAEDGFTDAAGDANLEITHAVDAQTYFLVVDLGGRKTVSGAIAIT